MMQKIRVSFKKKISSNLLKTRFKDWLKNPTVRVSNYWTKFKIVKIDHKNPSPLTNVEKIVSGASQHCFEVRVGKAYLKHFLL